MQHNKHVPTQLLIHILSKSQRYNPNEQKLFHGTHGPEINDTVEEDGIDDRFFRSKYTAVDKINSTLFIFI